MSKPTTEVQKQQLTNIVRIAVELELPQLKAQTTHEHLSQICAPKSTWTKQALCRLYLHFERTWQEFAKICLNCTLFKHLNLYFV